MVSKAMETKKKTSLKTNKKPKKSSKAKQIVNTKKSPEEKRREMLDTIIEKTGLGENEIVEAEEKFKDDYPDGRITLEEFIDQSDVSKNYNTLEYQYSRRNSMLHQSTPNSPVIINGSLL